MDMEKYIGVENKTIVIKYLSISIIIFSSPHIHAFYLQIKSQEEKNSRPPHLVTFINATDNPFTVPNNDFPTAVVIITLAAVKHPANAILIINMKTINEIQIMVL